MYWKKFFWLLYSITISSHVHTYPLQTTQDSIHNSKINTYGSLAKASSVGANTVKGPADFKVSINLQAVKAAKWNKYNQGKVDY